MKRFPFLAVLVFVLAGTVVRGQTVTSDSLFDDTVVHDISLTINSREWQALKDH